MRHQHKANRDEQQIRAYTGGVATGGRYPQEPRAAGGICIVDYCACGAMRRTNTNAGYVERGPWTESEVAR